VVEEIYFLVETPFGVKIRTTKQYWKDTVLKKHPSIKRFKSKIKAVLKDPDQIRKSNKDPRVYLYYKSIGKLSICIVADHVNIQEGYIITAYPTDRIKEGEKVYEKDDKDKN